MTKKAIKNSFIFVLTLVQLINIHKKINKVVNKIKKREIPSTPTLKLRFKKGIHNILLTNWKELIDLLKKTHRNKEIIYVKQDIFKAITFSNKWFDEDINNNKNTPIKGNNKIKASKFGISNNNESNINTL